LKLFFLLSRLPRRPKLEFDDGFGSLTSALF
jgi:hypothetical protein